MAEDGAVAAAAPCAPARPSAGVDDPFVHRQRYPPYTAKPVHGPSGAAGEISVRLRDEAYSGR